MVAPLIPDYDNRCVTRIVPSLLARDYPTWFPEPVRDARGVVLVVLDGFGWELFCEYRDELPTLDTFVGDAITTVAPSTTAAALTSITTGTPPAQHGMVGYRMLFDDRMLNTISWKDETGKRGPDPLRVQPIDPFARREIAVISHADYEHSSLTDAHLRGCRYVGYQSAEDMAQHCGALATAGERFIYAYWPTIDVVAHRYGFRDGMVRAELQQVDALIRSLLLQIPDEYAVMITADHGGVHIEPDGWSVIEEPTLIARQGGEGRFRTLWATPGCSDALAVRMHERYDDVAWVRTRDEAFAEGWFGADASRSVHRRVGDVIVAPFAPVAFRDPTYAHERELLGMHGSLTAAEMLVPCIAGRGSRIS